MINVKDRYFSLNRTLLLIVGLWPYNKSKFAGFQLICCFIILISFITFQFTTFMTSTCSANFAIKIFSLIFSSISFIIQYNSFYVNSETVKYLMDQLQKICDNLKDNKEIAILERYGNYAKRFTVISTIVACSCILIFTCVQLWSEFNDVFLSNKSRSYHLWIEMEYFIDHEKYFYLLILHINASLYIGLLLLLATATTLYAYLQYICGMFKIASYRIENTMKIYMSQCIKLQKINLVEGIKYAVDMHRKAISFEITFMLLILCAIFVLSLNILRTLQIVSSKFNIEEFSISVISSFACILYMFFANFIGQEITNHYNYLFTVAYNVRWYMAPLHIQRLILLLVQRGNKTFGLNIGGLFVASLQCFATLTNTSMSYFTVMYTTQK
ncbi:uncharacterized protein [Anoplolepis gracilipes]|uniref:uncharacterized protein isoform X2 n=1 Tax=Anoplolepis gracilipes TaxID=354296 RepID=UPI003B9DFB0D